MAISTYTELKAALADWLLRDDLTAVIPTFISLAEADMSRNIRHWRMEKRATTDLDSRYSALPFDFLAPIRISVSGSHFIELEPTGQAEMLRMRQNNNNASGQPRYYAIMGGEIEVFPTPAGNYTLEMAYYSRTDALSDSNPANWLLTYHPDIYLYGALLQSAPYLKDDERIGVWKGLHDQGVAALGMEANKAKFGSAGLRLKIRSY